MCDDVVKEEFTRLVMTADIRLNHSRSRTFPRWYRLRSDPKNPKLYRSNLHPVVLTSV